jgi:hypothetical protein
MGRIDLHFVRNDNVSGFEHLHFEHFVLVSNFGFRASDFRYKADTPEKLNPSTLIAGATVPVTKRLE